MSGPVYGLCPACGGLVAERELEALLQEFCAAKGFCLVPTEVPAIQQPERRLYALPPEPPTEPQEDQPDGAE